MKLSELIANKNGRLDEKKLFYCLGMFNANILIWYMAINDMLTTELYLIFVAITNASAGGFTFLARRYGMDIDTGADQRSKLEVNTHRSVDSDGDGGYLESSRVEVRKQKHCDTRTPIDNPNETR